MSRNVEVDDVLIYRGENFLKEKNREQIVTSVDVNGSFFTKFLDCNDESNFINIKSAYYEECEIISKDDVNINLSNGVPLIWNDLN